MTKIQILGTGCPKCAQLAEAAETAAQQLGLDYDLKKVTEIGDIVSFGVMTTPALVVDGEVKAVGKAPSVGAVKQMLA